MRAAAARRDIGSRATLIAEAVRHYAEAERLDAAALSDAYAESQARRTPGSVSRRIAAWAVNLPLAERFARPLAEVRAIVVVVLALFLLAGFVGGFSAGAAALGRGGTVNILYVLGAVLGAQLALLVVWLVLSVAAPARPGAPSPLGRIAVWLAARIGERPLTSAETKAVWRSFRALFREGALARWALGAVSHAVWLAFSIGALLACTSWMVFFQYDFVWATTLLSDAAAVQVIALLAALPEALQLSAPDEQLIAASRFGTDAPAGREVWSRFLLASILLYGIVPRLLALALSIGMTIRAVRRLDVDLTEPFFGSVWQRLQPPPPTEPEEPLPPPDLGGAAGAAAVRAFGSGRFVATLAIELDDTARWPVEAAHWRQIDLGLVDSRSAARRVLAQLGADFPPPRALLVVSSMARSPDRGTADLLARIVQAASVPVLLVLAEGELLARRGGDVDVRERDWRRYARAAGVAAVAVMELEALAAARLEEIEAAIERSWEQ